ncbi:hypothetical protein EST38_g5676 [Candolleomyces aberdarensis]|uniref:J domain-containing protein n=1 Tax=Candolleomyces aberdarensis TaxID=2316362 RepID=A0A4Q2DLL5_9AGAR|nr:hypothetical protein EST38_g5676 [Candolleomyces aberdarensis]
MWFSSGDDEYPTAEEAEIDLYAVLNLNRAASQTEINERYRALSLLFHPDKQQNPVRKEAAEEEYLKVQKAYQVLSDPFLRQVYDVLGLRAVSLRWPENFPTQSQEKIYEELRKIKKNGFLDKQVDEELRLKTHSSATLDASALFRRGTGADPASLWTRLTGVRVVLDDFRHTFSRRINSSTFVVVMWEQQFTLPIILTTDASPTFVGVSLLFPSVAAVLSYHFLIRPRRRTQRIAQIRAARRALEEDSDARRKQNATTDLLKDVAHRNTSLEEDKGGLIIQEASYGVTDETDGAENLSVDVTIPLQALVRNSRLYIPGGRSKSNLQGFSDPAVFTSKTLRIRYVFRGRSHYAAIPDYLPVVLPLSEQGVRKAAHEAPDVDGEPFLAQLSA